ncbi:MAG: tdh [Clostridia bacterium]|jgi:L-iditol 2-dehydrogenase|nr:tdh [Clostridia bacterium]
MTNMKAAVLHAPGDLRIEDVKKPEISKANEVLVSIKAAGICGSDLDRVLHTGTYKFPTIPGHEFCGVIEAIGENVKNFKVGDRVVVAPMLPCMTCESCAGGNYGQCEDYDFIGSRRDGAFAEYVVAPEINVLKMPYGVSFEEGAVVEPAAVTLHGMRKVKVNPGETVVVLGCGPIGQIAVQFSKIMGATKVIAVDILDEKLEEVKKLGADITINSMKEDVVEAIKKATNGKGAEVTIETAGSNITQEQSLRVTKNLGRILLLGTAHKDVIFPPKSFERIVRGELELVGSWNSYSAPFPGIEWKATMDFINTGQLKVKPLITHRFKLEEALNVFNQLKNRELSFNKIIFFNE